MQRVKHYAKGLWVDTHLSQWLTNIMIIVHVGFASAIVIGGIKRFTAPSYQPLIDYSNGNVWVWGVWIFASAILMSVPFRKLNIVGLWLGMFWHMIWMTCFAIAVNRYDIAAATPVVAYGGFAMICTALLTARVIDKSKE